MAVVAPTSQRHPDPAGGMNAADLSGIAWLVSPQAQPWLSSVAASAEPLPAQVKRLRRALSPEQTHLVLEQVELRRRARAKFSRAAEMFFTRRSLEQATSEAVGAWKAQRFARLPHAATSFSEPPVAAPCFADLCCGIGGDLLALGAHGPVVGVERDAAVVLLARANLAVLGLAQSVVRRQDVAEFPVDEVAAWHLDPDRRPAEGRIAQPEFGEPGLEAIERLLHRNPRGAIKLAPAAIVPEAWRREAELEWISEEGECKQQVAWCGNLAHAPGQRAATALRSRGAPTTFTGQPDQLAAVARRLERFLYEPDPAVLAAGLGGALAAQQGLAAIAPNVAYFTADHPVHDPLLAAFEVQDVLPLDRKRMKAWLRERGMGRVEIKKRGVEIDVPRLREELRVAGEHTATLLIAPLASGVTAIVARRLPQP